MSRKTILAAAFAIAGACFAADTAATNTLDKAERRRIRRERRIARDGGLVTKPNLGRKVYFVNAQSRIGGETVEDAASVVAEAINMPVATKALEPDGDVCAMARRTMGEKSAGAAVLLVEDDRLPSIVVAPEKSWAAVNVTALAADFPPKSVLGVRVRKELTRAAAWALGAGESMMKPCIMQYEPTLEALDANRLMLPSPDPVMRMVNGAMARGIDTVRTDTYRRACQEGWAPAPTNDVQRAIWEQVRADKERGPTKPITISPPNKKN